MLIVRRDPISRSVGVLRLRRKDSSSLRLSVLGVSALKSGIVFSVSFSTQSLRLNRQAGWGHDSLLLLNPICFLSRVGC
jgi:hypothetical protein